MIFFFSSRRLHTRFSRDWSSDVCSSDLRVRPYLIAAKTCGSIGPQFLVSPSPDFYQMRGSLGSPMKTSVNKRSLVVLLAQIGRASCRERVKGVGVWVSVEVEKTVTRLPY